MRSFTALSLLLAVAGTQVAGQSATTSAAAPEVTSEDAIAVTNNPVGVVYKATLPEQAFFKPAYPDGGNVKGEITASAGPNGAGVIFNLKFSNLPKTGGPFMYHLHVDPVPSNGNCTATLAHLDPTARGEAPICDPEDPETCQVGDLSGKFGDIPVGDDVYETTYTDMYASTLEGIGAFFGNRSIVFHYANKTRITCANFVKIGGDGDDGHGHASSDCSSGSASGYSSSSSSAPVPLPSGNATVTSSSSSVFQPTGGLPSSTGPSPSSTSGVIAAANRVGESGAVMMMLGGVMAAVVAAL